MRVLHVDDDPGIRDAMENFASVKHPELVLDNASNGEEAYSQVVKKDYGCVITDCDMPYANGIDLANKLTHNGYGGAIIFYTAQTDRRTAEAIIETGADEIFIKAKDGFAEVLDYVSDRAVCSCGD